MTQNPLIAPRSTREWQAADSQHYLHPFTDFKQLAAHGARIITRADGVYLYDAKAHRLEKIISGDLRAATGTQPYVAEATLNLVYVADYAKMPNLSDADKILYSAADTGFIGQNVYLYCASEGLATVIRASIDRDALGKALKLGHAQKITLAQSVGYPKPSN